MTAIIDLFNSNPATCVTYADDAVGMTAGDSAWDEFFGHYPVLLKNGVEVRKLNPNNFDQFEDGTTDDISSGDALADTRVQLENACTELAAPIFCKRSRTG